MFSKSIREILSMPISSVIGVIPDCGLWCDWFCSDKALANRGKTLISKLNQIKGSKRFDIDTCCVLFKNNCRAWDGKLYDDFRISEIETDDVIFTVVPKNCNGISEIYGRENNQCVLLFSGTWKDAVKWFMIEN